VLVRGAVLWIAGLGLALLQGLGVIGYLLYLANYAGAT
jgi:hypothetical protein